MTRTEVRQEIRRMRLEEAYGGRSERRLTEEHRMIGLESGPNLDLRMTTSIVSLSEFKARAAQMLSEMKATEHPIVLTQRGAASAVVHDYRAHQRHQNALLMLKLMVQGEADVAKGRTIAQERVFADLRARLTDAAEG